VFGLGQGRVRPKQNLQRAAQRRGFVALIVEPIAPNFAALRRVSSDVDRAYVSTRSPCSMSV
jgi:hypothetical protein